jgi:photosystem II stability/assembly factor-like uncharacterized protein
MKKIFLPLVILILLLAVSSATYSQEWVRLFNDPTANFYDIQREFNSYWADKTPERGQGWMVFKRWEYFMEPRVYPTGTLPDFGAAFKEIQKYKQSHPDNINDLANWSSMGPYNWLSISYNPGIGRMYGITPHPYTTNILFTGAASGGLWMSQNAGLNWVTVTDNLEVLGVSGICIHPANPNIMYIATGDGDGGANYSIGVLKSTTGGFSWNTTGLSYQVSQGLRVYKMVMSPVNPDILVTVSNFGIHRTTNGGVNWTQVITNSMRDIEYHPSNPNIIYAAGTVFFKSTDAGVTFTQTGTGIPTTGINRLALGVSPAGANYVYALASASANSGFFGFYRSTDAGETFVETMNSPNILGYNADGSSTGGQGTYDLCVAVSPINVNEVFTGGINIWKSTNAGDNFECNTHWVYPSTSWGYVHADVHTLDFVGNDLFTGTDGGLFKSTNFGANWIDLSAGLATTQFYRFGGTPMNPDLLIGGTQDNGTNRYTGVWTHVLGADGMEAAIDYTTENIMYACIQNGGLRRSMNGGNSFSSIVNNITGTGAWVTPYVLDPVDPQTIYAGYQDVWESTDRGSVWKKLTEYNGASFRSLAIAKSNNNYIYAGTYTTIYKTTDKGYTWKDITTGLPGNSKTYIYVSSSNPNEVWVTLSGYTAGEKVYYSPNGGDSWENISGTLPNLPANTIIYLDPDRLFLGMDVGVFYRDKTMTDWEPFMTNLPNVKISEFEIHEGTNKIRAATYGRGIWESPIPPMVGNITGGNNIPQIYKLYQNYPNPFNPQTIIRFDIASKSNVTLTVFNILGQEVRTLINSEVTSGEKSVVWDGKNNYGTIVNSGIYIYELRAGDYRDSKKMVFMK